MLDKIKVAAAQTYPKLMKPAENLTTMLNFTRKAAENKAHLIAFPECHLTGYVFSNLKEATPFAETIPGASTEAVVSLCRELNIFVIFGLLEKENKKLYNSLAFAGPEGLIASYRKNHLPFLGIDRFVTPGDRPFQVHQTTIGNVGMHICYDVQFPESARVMALMGADIIVLATNFPQGRSEKLNCLVRARAVENKVHVVCANRIGGERSFSFDGYSIIINARGDVLSTASHDREEIIYGEVSLKEARQKHHVFIPGEWEIDNFASRRPELYGIITQPKEKRK